MRVSSSPGGATIGFLAAALSGAIAIGLVVVTATVLLADLLKGGSYSGQSDRSASICSSVALSAELRQLAGRRLAICFNRFHLYTGGAGWPSFQRLPPCYSC